MTLTVSRNLKDNFSARVQATEFKILALLTVVSYLVREIACVLLLIGKFRLYSNRINFINHIRSNLCFIPC